MKTSPSQEHGSILIWILVAVVLLAGLTTVINQGSRTSTGMLSEQQARLAATEIIQYGNALRQATQRLLLNGCSENDLNFGNTTWLKVNGDPVHAEDHNPNASGSECSVFSANGGGGQAIAMPWQYTSRIMPGSTNTTPGHGRILRMAIPGVGTDEKEEINVQIGRLNKDVCLYINAVLGIPMIAGNLPTYTVAGGYDYDGSFTDTIVMTDDSGLLHGKRSFCAESTNGDHYGFWQVLHER